MTKTDPAERPSALEVAQGIERVEQSITINVETAVFRGLAIVGIGLMVGGGD